MRCFVVKADGGYLVPASGDDKDELDKLRNGSVYRVDIIKERNSLFHRKVLSLIRLGFNSWIPEEPKDGSPAPLKNYDTFRNDITVLAGFSTRVFKVDGSFELIAKSISFANMDEIEFEALFSAIADVLLGNILSNYSREDLDEVVEKILGYTG